MSQQTIELSGIVRNLPDKTVKDGMMQELINLRPRDGALRTVGKKTRAASTPSDVRYIHKINDTIKVFIGVMDGYINYWVEKSGTMSVVHTTSFIASENMSFATLHNTLMISEQESETTKILLFDFNTDSYLEYSDLTPDMPVVSFQRVAKDTYDEVVESGNFSIYDNESWQEAKTGEILKLINSKSLKGMFVGNYLVRCAWELSDGTIVRHTLPHFISSSEITQKYRISNWIVGGWGVMYETTFTGYDIQYRINVSAEWLTAIKAQYKNLVKYLNIYITRTHTPSETKDINPHIEGTPDGATDYSDIISEQPYIPDIRETSYCLLKQINLEDLAATEWKTVSVSDTTDMNAIATNEVMPVDNFTHHKISAAKLFSYNERIFLANVKNILYQGFDPSGYISPEGSYTGDEYSVGFEFDIHTTEGTKTVFSGWAACTTYLNNTYLQPTFQVAGSNSNYWGYPDLRAKKARLLILKDNIIYNIDEISLVPVPAMNFSYFGGFLVEMPLPGLTAYPTYTLKSNMDYYYDHNRVQATEINNPFYFPAINSYRIGFGKILGMSTNAIALSQGQFGQFPIFCFTTDGIWTMNIGSGENLINTITPLSRHVCNNPDSITPIDGGTAFTTNKGLFIISGTQVIEISDLVDGAHNSRITGTVNYEAIANNPNLYQIKDYLCAVPFLTYVSGAKIAWDHSEDHKELIISNSSYNYSWVYNLKHKIWFKISQVWESFVTDYPRTYGYKTVDATYYQDDMGEEEFSEYIPAHLETRPLKLSRNSFKMLNRLLVQGYLSEPEKPFSVNLFGSTNNISWHLMNNGKLFSNGYLPLLLGRTTFSCQYFILVLGGEVDEDFYLTHVDVDFDERYGNKLR